MICQGFILAIEVNTISQSVVLDQEKFANGGYDLSDSV